MPELAATISSQESQRTARLLELLAMLPRPTLKLLTDLGTVSSAAASTTSAGALTRRRLRWRVWRRCESTNLARLSRSFSSRVAFGVDVDEAADVDVDFDRAFEPAVLARRDSGGVAFGPQPVAGRAGHLTRSRAPSVRAAWPWPRRSGPRTGAASLAGCSARCGFRGPRRARPGNRRIAPRWSCRSCRDASACGHAAMQTLSAGRAGGRKSPAGRHFGQQLPDFFA